MKKGRVPIALLLAAIMLADLAVALILDPARRPRRPPSETTLMLAEALAFSQVSLAAIWLVLGGSAAWATWRLAALWPVLAFWSRLLRSPAALDLWQAVAAAYAAVFLVQTAAIAVPLVIARYAGVTLADVDSGGGRLARFQFSVRNLFVWTAGLFVFLSLLSYAARYEMLAALPLAKMLPLIALGLAHASIGLVGLWFALGSRRLVFRAATLGLALGTVTMVYAAATYRPPPPGQLPDYSLIRRFLLIVLWHASGLVVYLWMVRFSGFRLVRPGFGHVAAEGPAGRPKTCGRLAGH
jgi:hypothetical protein